MADSDVLLKLDKVSKRYDSPDDSAGAEVLKGISLEVGQGESLAVVGASGSGKSTLLNIIGTLDKPSKGSVYLEGKDLAQLDELELSNLRNQQIGFIFQLHHLLGQCTVLENVLVPTLLNKNVAERTEAEERSRRLLQLVGLEERLTYRPGQLSGGERQRVAVVRALINQPQLLLADEPTGSLDAKGAEKLAELLVELNKEENVTLIMVTHSMAVAKQMQRVFELRDGQLMNQENQ
ncbi:MAG: ABC transporter ATP-binding protein [Planctomycetes bacterium]|nr:ABC transporter ATP-binding protein [Planctomycetota bacterium]